MKIFFCFNYLRAPGSGVDLEPCRRAPEAGRCRPLNCSANLLEKKECEQLNFQRWFFNAHTSNCEPFNYTGCGGSENTFDDADSCHSACKARIVRPDSEFSDSHFNLSLRRTTVTDPFSNGQVTNRLT